MTMNRNQYPCVEFDLDKLAANLAALVERCHDSLIEVAGVVKAVSSLPEIVRVYEESGVKFIATSRISQMRAIREAGICKKPLMLIRIPMLSELPDVVELCDISLQSDIIVLRALNEEAKKQGKVHEVILMMDLGDLREGFWNEEDALDAALEIEHELKNLRLAGVGVNLSCYGSVLPTKRNMQGLVSLASDIEREIGRKLDYISGGASTSAYMAMNGTMPYRINLLRLGDIGLRGETDNFAPDFLETGVMTIKAEVIECRDQAELSGRRVGRERLRRGRPLRGSRHPPPCACRRWAAWTTATALTSSRAWRASRSSARRLTTRSLTSRP